MFTKKPNLEEVQGEETPLDSNPVAEPDKEPDIPPKSFPFQTMMADFKLRMENVEGYVWEHDPNISWLMAEVVDLKNEVVKLRGEMLHSAGYEALNRDIQRNRRELHTHLQSPHRTGN